MALSPVYGEFRAACKMLSVESEHSVNACRHDPSIAQRKDLLALPVQAEEKHLLQHLLARHGAERRGSRQVHDGLHVDVVVLCACSFTVFEPPVTEGGGKRYEAYGRQVLTVNDENKDVDAIRTTIKVAKAYTGQPTLIKCTGGFQVASYTGHASASASASSARAPSPTLGVCTGLA